MDINKFLRSEVSGIRHELVNINSGGCGYFALTLHQALANVGIASEMVLVKFGMFGYTTSQVDEMIADEGCTDINSAWLSIAPDAHHGNVRQLYNGHVGLRVNGVMYDSTGEIDFPAISEAISIEAMDAALDMPRTWNPCFVNCNSDGYDAQECVSKFEAYFDALLAPFKEVIPVKKLTNTQANDKFMSDMRAKGMDTIFISELPHPTSTRNCTMILSKVRNLIYIRDEVVS